MKLQFSKAINLKCKLKNSMVKMISKDFNLTLLQSALFKCTSE